MKEIKDSLKENGYDFEMLEDGIISVPNFFSEEDLIPVWDLINLATQDDWEKEYRESQKELARRLYQRDDLNNLIDEGIMEYTYNWNDKSLEIPSEISKQLSKNLAKIFKNVIVAPFNNIQRQYEGAPLVEHVDDHADPYIKFAAIGYINDDYNGGNLVFPNLNLKLKPKKQSLLIFQSGDKYLHGVEAPLPGPTRYVLPTFIY